MVADVLTQTHGTASCTKGDNHGLTMFEIYNSSYDSASTMYMYFKLTENNVEYSCKCYSVIFTCYINNLIGNLASELKF